MKYDKNYFTKSALVINFLNYKTSKMKNIDKKILKHTYYYDYIRK